MGYQNVGSVWDVPTFRTFVAGQNLRWANGVCLHHTASPSLADRPAGFKIQHMRNLEHFYRNELGWSAGPHLFIDEDQIFGMSSLEERGVHAKSFNANYIGIEVLGDYDNEECASGRGLQCWQTAAAAVSILLQKLDVSANSIVFHRDDPKTSKTCPGKKVEKSWFLSLLDDKDDDRSDQPAENNLVAVEGRLAAIEWQVSQIRGILK